MEQTKSISVKIDRDLLLRMQAYADKSDRSLSSLVRLAVRDFLENPSGDIEENSGAGSDFAPCSDKFSSSAAKNVSAG